jgi:predicted neutral ceramidase superfamily lipid hydrolase
MSTGHIFSDWLIANWWVRFAMYSDKVMVQIYLVQVCLKNGVSHEPYYVQFCYGMCGSGGEAFTYERKSFVRASCGVYFDANNIDPCSQTSNEVFEDKILELMEDFYSVNPGTPDDEIMSSMNIYAGIRKYPDE